MKNLNTYLKNTPDLISRKPLELCHCNMNTFFITTGLILLFWICPIRLSAQGEPGTFIAGKGEFVLNGKPFVIRAAELHYPRIPREYWENRIQMCKAMGMNTICIYLFWNIHEQTEGIFNFSGQNDVAAFVRLVKKNGMYCVVRPGPYVCAEWDMGGLPWWLLKKQELKLRTLADEYFIDRTQKFFDQAALQLAPLQIQNGGNIIMVQVENEYASFGSDVKYMERIRDGIRSAGFDKVQLFRCDWSSNFNKYKLDGVSTTLNFGAGSNIDNQFKLFSEIYPNSPKMCSEYWTGWFDHWGKPHETRSIESFIGSLKDMMDRKISFSLYMAHGGTSFGQWGGANAGPYSAMATTYDYNAPIDEQGRPTDKFYAIRNLLKNYLQGDEILAEIPKVNKIISIPKFKANQHAGIFENLPKSFNSRTIQSMEDIGQGWGRILYRTTIPKSNEKQKLVITEVHDWASIFINGKLVGKLDRRRGETEIEIPALDNPSRLDILVEATGRVNYGKAIADRKGITKTVAIRNSDQVTDLFGWQIYSLPVDYSFQAKAKFRELNTIGPGWYKGNFNLKETGDAFLDMREWGKGMVWVNGHNIGRFWKIGPQQTLFLPAVWLKTGKNEVIVFDLEGPKSPMLAGLDKPILNQVNPDESLFHRKVGQKLNLEGEKSIASGSFENSPGWKEVSFPGIAKGRYFCFESLSAQRENDNMSSMAEIELIGTDGTAISTLKWKVPYADSEEINITNNGADKVFDQQESTFWQTSRSEKDRKHPHHFVIDLGESISIKGLRYLSRNDKKTEGMVKDFRVFLKELPFVITDNKKKSTFPH